MTLYFFAISWYAVTASGILDTGSAMSSARDTDECPGLRAEREVITAFLAAVQLAISFLSLVGVTLMAPTLRAISSTVFISLSTGSGSPSTSIMQRALQSGRGLPLALLTASMETLSMSSQDAGISGLAIRAETQRPASCTLSKAARM